METNGHLSSLIQKAKVKNSESSRELYEHLVDKVFPFVRYRTNTEDEALDLTQDVFVDFFTHIDAFTFETGAQLYAYVFTITRRKLARHYEKAKRNTVSFEEGVMGESRSTAETESELRRVLEGLDARAREIIELHHFSRFSFGEIAHMFGVNESAVRVAHHRTLATLRERFKGVTP